MRSIRRLQFFIALTLTSISAITQPADLAAQKEALTTIADFADRLCQSPPLEGSEQDFELSGSAKAELNEVVKKVVDLGIEGAAKYKSSEYQGVLQKDLANVVKDSSNCKREVWRDLKDKLIPKVEETNTPPFRVTYYRLSGVVPNFLIKGLLAPEWAQALGGPQNIVPNAVFAEAKSFLERFSEDFQGYVFYGDYPPLRSGPRLDINDYARQLTGQPVSDSGRRTNDQWKAYLAGNQASYLFIPDIEAAQDVLGSMTWPSDCKIYYPKYAKYDIERNIYPPPTVWRYLRRSDLTNYYKQLRQYRTLAEQRISDRPVLHSGLPWYTQNEDLLRTHESADRIVESLLYLTQRSLPESFMIVEGYPVTHGGWSFLSQVRNLELEVAVFESIRNEPIEVGDFEYLELIADGLRYTEETDSALATAPRRRRPLHAPPTLLPAEKLIIPLQIHFTLMNPLEVLEEDARQVLQQKIASATERIQLVDSRNDPLMSKSAESLLPHEPPQFVKRFDFGPAWSLERVVVNGKAHAIREPDWTNFSVFLSSEKGSCPYVFTLQPETGIWLNEGHLLLGATAPELTRRDTIELRHFNGRVQLRELEAEVAVIRQATLEIVDG